MYRNGEGVKILYHNILSGPGNRNRLLGIMKHGSF